MKAIRAAINEYPLPDGTTIEWMECDMSDEIAICVNLPNGTREADKVNIPISAWLYGDVNKVKELIYPVIDRLMMEKIAR